ncbi:MAG: SurA N-terminal domain-containing protein [Rhodospirillales bacterium]|jgi:peptidyl-prolyl cis-trans isomerase D|nr:SurA N-terminal domain-containing protein [Rhodospirillales bacterium]
MLETIRKYTGSFVVKLLFVILILSFGVWGVADVFRPGGGSNWAVRVGDVEIPQQTIRDDYQRELRRLRQALGEGITDETARAFGLPNQVISGVVARTLLDLESDRLGLIVSDEEVRASIQADPTFRGPNGEFDPNVLRQVLQLNGLSEDGFVRLVRGDIVRRMLIGSAMAGARVPEPIVDALYRHREERRTAEVVLVPVAAVADVAAPDEAQIKAFYETHPERFSAPEFRAATAVVLSAPAVAKGLSVPEAEVAEAYAARRSEFIEPERRSLEQVLVQDEAAAKAAGERLRQGAQASAVASELGQTASGGRLEKVSQAQLPRELAAVAFRIGDGEVSEPIKSGLGWHVLKVTGVEPGREKSLAEVREQLARELAENKAVDEVYALSTRLEDALGAGAPLEDAANALGLDIRRVEAIDAGGRDRSGAAVADLPEGFAQTVFAIAEKSESVLTESGRDTFYVVRVDAVTPSGLKPLGDVRADVVAAWTAEQRAERAKARAGAIADAARGTGALAGAAEAQGLSARTTPPFQRATRQPVEGVPAAIIDAAFAAEQGEVAVVPADSGSYVVRVASVIEADPKAQPEAVASLRAELEGQAQEDTLAQLSSGIRREFPVTMNQSAIEQMF